MGACSFKNYEKEKQHHRILIIQFIHFKDVMPLLMFVNELLPVCVFYFLKCRCFHIERQWLLLVTNTIM